MKKILYCEITLYELHQSIYLIDLNDFTEKQQNQFLKLIEEPSVNVYIALIAESEIGILDTILNRCIKYRLEPYTKAQLQEICLQNNLQMKIL